jgi:hypothetical protein
MKIKVLRDQPMDLLEAVRYLKDGKCIGIMPEGNNSLYITDGEFGLRWNRGGSKMYISDAGKTWCPVIYAPEPVTVEITAEEVEMLFRALNALTDTSKAAFCSAEWALLDCFANRANKAFKSLL